MENALEERPDDPGWQSHNTRSLAPTEVDGVYRFPFQPDVYYHIIHRDSPPIIDGNFKFEKYEDGVYHFISEDDEIKIQIRGLIAHDPYNEYLFIPPEAIGGKRRRKTNKRKRKNKKSRRIKKVFSSTKNYS
jgi:hypothetical protein